MSKIPIDAEMKEILDRYPDNKQFLLESVKILDRLLQYPGERLACYTKESISVNWKTLIQSCQKSIDYLLETTCQIPLNEFSGLKLEQSHEITKKSL